MLLKRLEKLERPERVPLYIKPVIITRKNHIDHKIISSPESHLEHSHETCTAVFILEK